MCKRTLGMSTRSFINAHMVLHERPGELSSTFKWTFMNVQTDLYRCPKGRYFQCPKGLLSIPKGTFINVQRDCYQCPKGLLSMSKGTFINVKTDFYQCPKGLFINVKTDFYQCPKGLLSMSKQTFINVQSGRSGYQRLCMPEGKLFAWANETWRRWEKIGQSCLRND